VKALLF